MFSCLFIQFLWINRFAVFDDDMYFFDTREMCFKNVSGIVHADRNNCTSGLFCNFKCAVAEWEYGKLFALVAGSFRENADGNAIFYIINCLKDRLQTFSHIVPVKEETVQILHPGGEKRNFFHFFFRNVAGQALAAAVGQKNVKIAAVVADEREPVRPAHSLRRSRLS